MAVTDHVEILSSRLFGVAPSMLFEAFADPVKLAQWWGPDGFTNEIHEFDLRPGGRWVILMKTEEGAEFLNHSTFQEVLAPERIVFLHHDPIHVFTLEMDFRPEDGGTRLSWRMLMEPNEENTKFKAFIAYANEQNFDRLERVLGLTNALTA
ncbi:MULTISPECIES: SRPBCC domain-containing protein [Alphaproteobacteria]|uniref:SRPBCC domain-containing protein n=1 Tax=Alphaproteobacteria TaxID=28211 RepID=UPI001F2FF8AD|nr:MULTISPECIES: SRPBCC domain-containing protein [Alphaproteobacteria]